MGREKGRDAGETIEKCLVPFYRASRPGWGAVAGTPLSVLPLPANSSCSPPHSAAAGGAGGGSVRAEVEEGAGARRGAFLPLPQRETRRRGGGGRVPQPRSCDSLEARAAGVSGVSGTITKRSQESASLPQPPLPSLQLKTRPGERQQLRRGGPSGPGPASPTARIHRRPRQAPGGQRARAPRSRWRPCCRNHQTFPQATAYSSIRAALRDAERKETQATSSRASFLPRLSPPGKQGLQSGPAKRPAGGSALGAESPAAPAAGTASASSDLKGQSLDSPILSLARASFGPRETDEAGREQGYTPLQRRQLQRSDSGHLGDDAGRVAVKLASGSATVGARSFGRRRAELAREAEGRDPGPLGEGRREAARGSGRERGRGGGAVRAERGLAETARPLQPGGERRRRPVWAGGRWNRRGRCRGRGRARTATKSRPTHISR